MAHPPIKVPIEFKGEEEDQWHWPEDENTIFTLQAPVSAATIASLNTKLQSRPDITILRQGWVL